MPAKQSSKEFFPPHHQRGFFCSSAWNNAWHAHWGDHPKLEPLGHTPELYRFRQRKRGIIPLKTALPKGASSSAARSIRCEYFCLGSSDSTQMDAIDRYLETALTHSWDQLYLPDILENSDAHEALVQQARQKGLYITEQERETAYAVDLRSGSFNDYLNTLGKNTRLKLFNRRKRLAQSGEVEVQNLWPDRERFYQLLDSFHQERWGKRCYNGRNREFIDALLTGLSDSGQEVDLSVMTLSGEPISVALDITAHNRCYNFQAGYKEDLIKGVSLGTLHLGYQIEKAFEKGADFYDFMAGTGKNSQYKASIANAQCDLVSLLVIRNPLLKLAYRFRDARQ